MLNQSIVGAVWAAKKRGGDGPPDERFSVGKDSGWTLRGIEIYMTRKLEIGEIYGKTPQIIHLFIGFGTIIFTIDFGVALFLETPIHTGNSAGDLFGMVKM